MNYIFISRFPYFFSDTNPDFIMRSFIVIVILGFLATFTAAGKFKLNLFRETLTGGTKAI